MSLLCWPAYVPTLISAQEGPPAVALWAGRHNPADAAGMGITFCTIALMPFASLPRFCGYLKCECALLTIGAN